MEWGVVGFERAGGEEEEEGGLGNPMVVLKREMGGGGTEWMGGEGKGKGNEGIIGGIED